MRLLIGIVTYNSEGTIERCLSAIESSNLDGIDCKIVVYDNASQDKTSEIVKDKHPNVQYIQGDDNRGYSYGVNRIQETSGWDYYLIMNPDLYLKSKDSLKIALDYAEKNKEAGIIGARLVDRVAKPVHSYGMLPHPDMFLYDFSGWRKILPRKKWSSNQCVIDEKLPFRVGFVTGAFMMIRRTGWENTGHFDEEYFLYFEDTDWTIRHAKYGGKVFVHPGVVAVHESGASFGKSKDVTKYKMTCYFRSAYRYFAKHFGVKARHDTFNEMKRNTKFKLKLLRLIGKGKSDAAKRQQMILDIHDEIGDDVLVLN